MSREETQSLSPNLSGSVTILNEEATVNENEASESIITNNPSETSTDAVLFQTQDRASSPCILVQLSEFYFLHNAI
jgi:hypothetical protein